MSDYISATLQDGSEAVALAAKPSGPQVIRAHGDRRRRRHLTGLAVAALAVVAVGAGAYPLTRDLSTAPLEGAGSIVPRVAGNTLASAERAVVRAGLSVGDVSRQRSDAVPLGLVIGTSPNHGASEPKGAKVNIVVSAGGGAIVVPNVVGMTETAAEQLLVTLHMRVEIHSAASPAEVPGTIGSESPPPGVRVPRGSIIVLSVGAANHGS